MSIKEKILFEIYDHYSWKDYQFVIEEGEKILKENILTIEERVKLLIHLASACKYTKKLEKGLKVLQDALDILQSTDHLWRDSKSDFFRVYVVKGDINLELLNDQEAFDDFTKALRYQPNNDLVLHDHIKIAIKLRKFGVAKKEIGIYLKLVDKFYWPEQRKYIENEAQKLLNQIKKLENAKK